MDKKIINFEDYNDEAQSSYDKAYELLEKAFNTKNDNKAKQLAKEAYSTCSDCIEAIHLLADLEPIVMKKENIMLDAIKKEKKKLEKKGLFEKENIGLFYTIYETRTYIKLLYLLVGFYMAFEKMNKAKETCLEIMRLNESDNIGVRYILMSLYAYFEDETALKKMQKKYGLDCLQALLPMLVLYYKKSDYKALDDTLLEINKVNKNFIKSVKNPELFINSKSDSYFCVGDISEVIVASQLNEFLLTDGLLSYIIDFDISKAKS